MMRWTLESTVQLLDSAPKIAGASITPFQDQVQEMRNHCGTIINQKNQPIPYPYYTTLLSMLLVNLSVTAYALTVFENFLSVPCYFMTCLVLLGLKEVSVGLADPFGYVRCLRHSTSRPLRPEHLRCRPHPVSRHLTSPALAFLRAGCKRFRR